MVNLQEQFWSIIVIKLEEQQTLFLACFFYDVLVLVTLIPKGYKFLWFFFFQILPKSQGMCEAMTMVLLWQEADWAFWVNAQTKHSWLLHKLKLPFSWVCHVLQIESAWRPLLAYCPSDTEFFTVTVQSLCPHLSNFIVTILCRIHLPLVVRLSFSEKLFL